MRGSVTNVKELLLQTRDEWGVTEYNQALVRSCLLCNGPLITRSARAYGHESNAQRIVNLGFRHGFFYVPQDFFLDTYHTARTARAVLGEDLSAGRGDPPADYSWPSYEIAANLIAGPKRELIPHLIARINLLNMPVGVFVDTVFAMRNPNGDKEAPLKAEFESELEKACSLTVSLADACFSDPFGTWVWCERAMVCLVSLVVPVAQKLVGQQRRRAANRRRLAR